MKTDMSPRAVSRRLKQVEKLRHLCLSLAGSSAGSAVQSLIDKNKTVQQRTSKALGNGEN